MRRVKKKQEEERAERDPGRTRWYDSDKYLHAKHTDKDLDAKKEQDRNQEGREAPATESDQPRNEVAAELAEIRAGYESLRYKKRWRRGGSSQGAPRDLVSE